MKKNITTILFSAVLVLVSSFSCVRAQEIPQSIDLVIQSTPTNPTPKEVVTLEAVSYSTDLYQATLTWVYGGKTVSSGIGNTRISVIAPTSGSVATASVIVSGVGIERTTATITLTPGSVDLVWEAADAARPPFYKGRSLPAPGGIFRVVAIPAANAPTTTSVEWSRGDAALPAASGVGKTSLVLEHSIFNKTEAISAKVHGGVFEGNGSIRITPRPPFAVVYQKKEGFTDYANGSKEEIAVSGPGTTLHIEPFFFSTPRNLASDLLFDIRVDGAPVYGEDRANEVRLSRPDEEKEHALSVSITPVSYSLQSLVQHFTLLFK